MQIINALTFFFGQCIALVCVIAGLILFLIYLNDTLIYRVVSRYWLWIDFLNFSAQQNQKRAREKQDIE